MLALFPNAASLAGAISLPSVPRTPLFAGVLDDAKSKAKDIQGQAKDFTQDKTHEIKDAAEGLANKASTKAQDSKGKIPLYSGKYYAACAFGGALACGFTHAFVTPLDLVKCRRQVDKNIYKGNVDGWKRIWTTEGGLKGIYTGVGPTFIGYSIQGSAKYGFYEYFKKTYSDMAGPENAKKYKDAIYLAGSASAEFFADMGLVPMEAVKVRMQTTIPPFAPGVFAGIAKFKAIEGTGGFFKSLPSLWGRQIPYTMMKFWSFEATVAKIYSSLGKPKESYNKIQQLGVSFVGGYIAGVFCAVVSHPADVMVSKLNAQSKDGSKSSVGSIYKEIGFGGLWSGLGTRIIMIGTLTALQWLIYDYVKTVFHLPTTGGAEPAQEAKA